MRIGFRTIKTAVGVSLAILIAQVFDLQYFTSAGILTLLCIQKSRKQSWQSALSRFIACMLGLASASIIFNLIGYYALNFLLLLLLFIPLCVKLRIQEGISTSSVIMMHVYLSSPLTLSFVFNELLIILIGIGVALIVNSYMPSIDKKLQQYRIDIDRLICTILDEMALYLKDGATDWDGQELLTLSDTIKQAKLMAVLDVENNWLKKDVSYFEEFEKKQQLYDLLDRMLPTISQISVQLEQGARIGDFMLQLSKHIQKPTHTVPFFEELQRIREYHRSLPMPETRAEFENRALLYVATIELERLVNVL